MAMLCVVVYAFWVDYVANNLKLLSVATRWQHKTLDIQYELQPE